MTSTIYIETGTEYLQWFYQWGNFIIFVFLTIAFLYIILNTYLKSIKAPIYKAGILISVALLIPSIFFSLSNYDTKLNLSGYILLFFILSMIALFSGIVFLIIYLLAGRKAKEKEYCSIHKIYYQNPPCPLCEVQSAAYPVSYKPSDPKKPYKKKAKGYLINKNNSDIYPLEDMNLLGRGETGSSECNKIKLDEDLHVSRIHAKIIFDGQKFKISDSSSRMGTLVNKIKIKDWRTLEDGDVIMLGKTLLKFSYKD